MFGNKVKQLRQMLQKIPIQMFGNSLVEANDVDGVQRFKLVSLPELGSLFGKKARYIVSEQSRQDGITKTHMAFPAYYIGYVKNELTSITLFDKADIMVTPPLDGCTVIATKAFVTTEAGEEEEKIKVYHYIALDEFGKLSPKGMHELYAQIPAEERENILFKIENPDYLEMNLRAPVTVMGLRDKDGWKFYSQMLTEKHELIMRSGSIADISSPTPPGQP